MYVIYKIIIYFISMYIWIICKNILIIYYVPTYTAVRKRLLFYYIIHTGTVYVSKYIHITFGNNNKRSAL